MPPFPFCLRPALVLLFLLALALPARAQDRPTEDTEEAGGGRSATDEESRYDELIGHFQRDYLRFTALVQIVPQIPLEDAGFEENFSVAAARFGIGGHLGGGIGYRLQAEFARSPALLDAFVSYQPAEAARFTVGRYKVPFSFESLTSAASTDFVNRARVVRALAPGREVGASARTQLAGETFVVRGGVFNATFGRTDEVDLPDPISPRRRGGVLAVGRVQSTFPHDDGTALILGANVGYDTPDTADDLDIPSRLLLGADARLRAGRFLLAAEGIVEQIEDDVFPERDGFYVTGGVDLNANNRFLVRFDQFDGTNEVLLGYNLTVTRAASFQANLVLPTDAVAEPTQALLNFQLAF